MKKILVFPTWIMLFVIRPFFPLNHPWKNKTFSLNDWSNGSTELNNLISFNFWLSILMIIILINKI